MRSERLLKEFLKTLKSSEGQALFVLVFQKPYYPINLRKLNNEFFVLLKPWIREEDMFPRWNISLMKLQKKIQGKFNRRLRNQILEIIYWLLVEGKRKNHQMLVAQSHNIPNDIIDFLIKNPLSFEITRQLASNSSLKEQHFNALVDHPRGWELFPLLARNESLPQAIAYQFISKKNTTISEALIQNPNLSSAQKLKILQNHDNNPYLLFLLLEQRTWPEDPSFWQLIEDRILENQLRDSLSFRLFLRDYDFSDKLLRKQKKFLKDLVRLDKIKPEAINPLLKTIEEKLSQRNGAKNKLSRVF